MKKTVAIFLSMVMILTALPLFVMSVVADDPVPAVPGTAAYVEALVEEGYTAIESFGEINNYSATAKYYLTKDVVLPATEDAAELIRNAAFSGVLDGNGHIVYNARYSVFSSLKGTLKNLTFSKFVNADEEDVFTTEQSLLGGIADGAVVENVISNRTFYDDIHDIWGAIVRKVPSNATVTFRNVINNSSIAFPWTAHNIKIGGFIGGAEAGSTVIFENCVNNGTVKGSQAGGFIAVLEGSNTVSFTGCKNTGTIIGSIGKTGAGLEGAYGVAGGFIGSYNNCYGRTSSFSISFENCINTGDVVRWQGSYNATTKETKVAYGGLIGNLGEATQSNTLTISIRNCTIADCTIGGETSWNDKVDAETGAVLTDYTQGYAGGVIGWVGTVNGADSITLENVVVRNTSLESPDPDHITLFLNTSANAQKTVIFRDCFAISCEETRAATGNVKFSYTADPSEQISVNKAQTSAAQDEKMAIRFLGGLDSLSYRGLGFVVEEKIDENHKNYYFLFNKKAYNAVNDGEGTLTKADFGDRYITAIVLDGVSATETATYKVTPYAINLEDSAIVGAAKSITLTAGSLS